MRVLVVTDYATPTGGAEAMTRTLRDGLRARGHEARIFASDAGLEGEPGQADYLCHGTTSRWRTLLQSENPWAARALRKAIEDFAPDVVHVRMFLTQLSPSILPVLRRVPAVCHAVWYRLVCPTGTKTLPDMGRCEVPAGRVCVTNGCLPLRDHLVLRWQRRRLARGLDGFDRFVANSQAVAARLSEAGIAPCTVVPNGVPLAEPRPHPEGPPAILFAGRLVPEKGADVLLRAFARVRERLTEARLVLAGAGPARSDLERLAGELGITGACEFTGQLAPAALDELRQRTWLQAVPSVWDEPFGIVASEAMMRGLPVVASDGGGLREFVRDGETGRLVSPGDHAALAEALTELLSDRERCLRLGAAAHQVARSELSDTVFLERLLGIYESLLEDPDSNSTATPR